MNTDFYGLPTRSIASRHLRLEILAQAGPRIVRLMLADSNENLLAEVPDLHWPTPYGEYYPYGGHRLTIAPEALGRSYLPEDGLIVEDLPDALRLVHPAENGHHIGKSITVQLHFDRPAVTLQHFIRNDGDEPLEIAPWAVTQLPLGGIAVVPWHASSSGDRHTPDRNLVLWPYTSWRDGRLLVDGDYVWIEAHPAEVECKVGVLAGGWVGYLRSGVFLLKRFDSQSTRPHPDRNCNAEVYCNDRFIELETLGSLCRLEPGQSVTHIETWEIHSIASAAPTPASLREVLRSIAAKINPPPALSNTPHLPTR